MLNEAVSELNVENKIKVQDISELLLTSIELSNHSFPDHGSSDSNGKTEPNILSLEQEDCHV